VSAIAQLPDGALVRSCRDGDDAAWSELVDRFERYVYAITTQVYRLAAHDAEDVFQEVFVRAYAALDRLGDDEAIRPWLGQITRRCCVDRLRAAKREDLVAEPPAEHVDETMARIDEALEVREALGELPGHCQEVLDRFFARDESYATIGDALDIAPGTIASRISRCLKKLREGLEGRSDAAQPS
jgi:RNA polymerase sigma-70 factor (ECF subfamily)